MAWRILTSLVLGLVLAGCTALLPSGSIQMAPTFDSFVQAQAAAQQIVPLQTRSADLKALGFDPEEGRNVTLIPYPDIIARLAPHPGVPLEALDPGIRHCIQAQAQCRAYLFHFERQDRERKGSFWLDFLNIRRVTSVRGWWLDTLVVVSNGEVLFRSIAGQAHSDRVDRQSNPLGPFQPAGESAGSVLLLH
jgi:hypothetical protein